MKNLLMRLTSRKFLLALGGSITLVANGAYGEAVSLVIAYILAEGSKDAVEAYKGGFSQTVTNYIEEEPEIDTTTIVTGNDTPLFNEKLKED